MNKKIINKYGPINVFSSLKALRHHYKTCPVHFADYDELERIAIYEVHIRDLVLYRGVQR